MATAVSQGATGNAYIDGVLSGVKWSGTVTYSFPDSAADYPGGYGSGEQFNDFAQISAQQQTAVHSIMQQIGNYTNLTITYAGTDGADIRMAHSDDANPTAYAYYPSNASEGEGGDVWFGDGYTNPVVGNYQYATHIHELGHAFGLKHGHETGGPGNIAIPADRDALEYTVMTYRSYLGGPTTGYTNEQFGYPQTFMMSDIAALQTMYGADYTYNSGNTVYSWIPGSGVTSINGAAAITPGGNRIFMTIWDGGGVDTYDFSAYSTGVTIDLGPGDYSIGSQAQLANLGNGNFAHGNVYNAYLFQGDVRSYIENAIGGSGNDTIIGNDANNTLSGGAGGTDTINGLSGIDAVSYASSTRGVLINLHAQGTWDGLVTDTLSSIENALGSSFKDTIWGSSEDNVLNGGAGGADTINGLSGIDTVSHASSTSGVLINLSAQGTWDGLVTDTLSSIENALGSSFKDTIWGSSEDNVLNGGAGADTMHGLSGNDTFVFNSGQGNGDTISDFVGNGAGTGDQFQFVGYGTAAQGATFTQVDATHWSINSSDGLVHDIISLFNGASIHSSDYIFV